MAGIIPSPARRIGTRSTISLTRWQATSLAIGVSIRCSAVRRSRSASYATKAESSPIIVRNVALSVSTALNTERRCATIG